MRADTRTIAVEADPGEVFRLVADPSQLPRWAVGFAKAIRQEGEGWVVQTGTGEVPLRVRADPATGTVDFVMRPTPDEELVASSRVLARGRGAEYVFTQMQPPGMPDEVFQANVSAVVHELTILKALLEVSCPL